LDVWWCCGLASLVALGLAVSGMSRPTASAEGTVGAEVTEVAAAAVPEQPNAVPVSSESR
jgi:hypothetical protein